MFFFAGSVTVAAGDATLGKKVMLKCQVCHDKDGGDRWPVAPNIAGQKEAYLIKAPFTRPTARHRPDRVARSYRSCTCPWLAPERLPTVAHIKSIPRPAVRRMLLVR